MHGARPGFIGVAAHVHARCRDQPAGLHVAQIDIDVEDEVRNLLHHAGDFEIGAELLRQFHIAAAAGLQIALMRRSIDRRDVEHLELAGLAQFLAQLVADLHQPRLFIRALDVHLGLEAGVDHLEIEHRKLRRIGGMRRPPHSTSSR